MSFIGINGIDLHYEVSGEGPTLVWLHGLMGSIARARQFGEDVDGLAGVRVLAWDARGHGESGYTANESDYSWAAHAEDLRALLDELDIERAAIGGGSMGAGVRQRSLWRIRSASRGWCCARRRRSRRRSDRRSRFSAGWRR